MLVRGRYSSFENRTVASPSDRRNSLMRHIEILREYMVLSLNCQTLSLQEDVFTLENSNRNIFLQKERT